MGSRSKDGNAGDDGEGSEGDEAEPVQHLQDCDQLGLWLFPVNVFGIIVTDPSHSLDNPDPYDVDFKPDRENISPWRQTSNRSRWRRRRRRPSVWTWSPDQTTMTERTVYLQIDVQIERDFVFTRISLKIRVSSLWAPELEKFFSCFGGWSVTLERKQVKIWKVFKDDFWSPKWPWFLRCQVL